MIPLRELLEIPELEQVRLIAGEKGLDRVVKNVTANDSPDGADWAKGGEIVLSSGYIWRDDPVGLLNYIRTLDAKKSAGFGIKIKRFLGSLPPDAAFFADEAGFPIILLPEHFTFDDFIYPALSYIVNKQASILRRSQEIHHELTESISCNDSIADVVETLSKLLNRKIVLISHYSSIESCASKGAEQFGEYLKQTPVEETSKKLVCFPVNIFGKIFFHIFVDDTISSPTINLTQEALYHAGTICRYIVQRQQSNKQIEIRFRNFFFQELLSGNTLIDGDLERRARLFDLDLNKSGYVMVIKTKGVDPPEFSLNSLTQEEFQRGKILKPLLQTLKNICPSSMTDMGLDRTVVFLPCNNKESDHFLFSIKDRIEDFFTSSCLSHDFKIYCGISGFCESFSNPAGSFKQALKVLEIIKNDSNSSRIATWEEIGFLRLVGDHLDPVECLNFIESILGKSILCPKNAHLLHTLTILDSEQWNLKSTSKALFVHYNTIKYRLRKIEQLIGKKIDSQETRLNISIAVRLNSYLKEKGQLH